MTTTISVSDETWKRLNRRKEPGESFDERVAELLDRTEPKQPVSD